MLLHIISDLPGYIIKYKWNIGKAANKLQIYLLFNEVSNISPVFQCLLVNWLLRAAENSSILNQSGATSFFFESISWTKMLICMCTLFRNDIHTPERIFLVLGNFYMVRIARN